MITDIILTLFLVFLNGFFVAAEFAIVKVRLSQIEIRLRSGSFLAKIAKNIVEHLDAYLSATQLGITLASLALGWIGESVVSDLVISAMSSMGYNPNPELAHSISSSLLSSISYLASLLQNPLRFKDLRQLHWLCQFH